MAKRKISATLTPMRVDEAMRLRGSDNLSEVLDEALQALIDRTLEDQWLAAHLAIPDDDLSASVPVDLSDIPWDD